MMRQLRLLPILILLGSWLCAGSSGATPVYMRMESRFPSGQHPRGWLEGRTRKVQFQRWLRIETQSKNKAYGWAPEDDLLTPLRLANEATLLEATPARRDMQMDAIDREILAKGTRVILIESIGSWVLARVVGSTNETWIPSEALRPVSVGANKAFVPKEAPVFVLPGPHARVQYQTQNSMFVQILSEQLGWLEIRSAYGRGFIHRGDAVTLKDLGESGALPITDLVPMRSAPLPYANVTRNLPRGTRLTMLATQTLRWGQAKIPDIGDIWWPITEDRDDEKDLAGQQRINTAELFKRKIFDMAASPAIPSLKLVSAQGVFRTIDGAEWMKIPLFEDKNYPIAVAGAGAIFVGPFVSDDHGETFAQWIRWDSLVATLRRSFPNQSPHRLRIQEIRPQDPAGRRVVLKLSLGEEYLVKLVTDDQGLSWRPL